MLSPPRAGRVGRPAWRGPGEPRRRGRRCRWRSRSRRCRGASPRRRDRRGGWGPCPGARRRRRSGPSSRTRTTRTSTPCSPRRPPGGRRRGRGLGGASGGIDAPPGAARHVSSGRLRRASALPRASGALGFRNQEASCARPGAWVPQPGGFLCASGSLGSATRRLPVRTREPGFATKESFLCAPARPGFRNQEASCAHPRAWVPQPGGSLCAPASWVPQPGGHLCAPGSLGSATMKAPARTPEPRRGLLVGYCAGSLAPAFEAGPGLTYFGRQNDGTGCSLQNPVVLATTSTTARGPCDRMTGRGWSEHEMGLAFQLVLPSPVAGPVQAPASFGIVHAWPSG